MGHNKSNQNQMQPTNFRMDAEEVERISYETFRERFDTNESLYLSEQLTAFEEQVYKVEYEDYLYNQLAPVVTDGSGLQSVGYYQRDKAGRAKIIASGAADTPNLSASMTKHVLPVRHFGAEYGWDWFQLQEIRRMRMPLESDMAMDARDAMELLLDDVFFDGDSDHNIPGLFSDGNSAQYQEATIASGAFTGKSADTIITEFSDQINKVYTGTMRRRRANMFLMPTAVHTHISTRPRSTTSDLTILDFLKKNFPYVNFVDSDKLDRASTVLASGTKSNKYITLAYHLDPNVLKYKVPEPFYQHPLERHKLMFSRQVTGDIAGLEVRNFSAFSIAAVDKT